MMPQSYQPPDFAYILGTDGSGRSVVAVLLEATLHTCSSVALAVAIATTIGLAVGLIATLARGRWLQVLCESAVTLSYSTPLLLVVMLVLSITGEQYWIFPVVAGTMAWGGVALATATSVSVVAKAPYVTASRALGAPLRHTLLAHILPNAAPAIRAAAFAMIAPITQLSVLLAFIGMGRAGLGALVRQGYDVFPNCWWIWLPATVVCVVLLAAIAYATQSMSRR